MSRRPPPGGGCPLCRDPWSLNGEEGDGATDDDGGADDDDDDDEGVRKGFERPWPKSAVDDRRPRGQVPVDGRVPRARRRGPHGGPTPPQFPRVTDSAGFCNARKQRGGRVVHTRRCCRICPGVCRAAWAASAAPSAAAVPPPRRATDPF